MLNRLLKRIDIDCRQYLTLVKMGLIMDFRTTEPGESGLQIGQFFSLIFSFLSSFVVAYFVMDVSLFSFCFITLSFSMIMMVFLMVAEFGRIIVNTDDYLVLASRPISSRTYFFAKLTHLLIYLLVLSTCLNLPPAILGIFRKGTSPFFPAIYFAASILAALFITELVVGGYGSLMRILSGRVLQNVLVYWQLAISVMSTLLFCFILPQLFVMEVKLKLDFLEISSGAKWLYGIPGSWFAGLIEFIHRDSHTPIPLLAGLALVMPLLLTVFLFRNISLHYAQRLLSINDLARKRKSADIRRLKVRIIDKILELLLRTPESLAAFSLVSSYLRRNQDTRMRIYSLMGLPAMLVIAMAVIGIKQNEGELLPVIATFAFMALCYVIHNILEVLKYSKEWKARWILGVAPIESVGEFFKGVRAAIALCLLLPFSMIQYLVCLVTGILGPTILGLLSAFIGAWCYLSFRSRFHTYFPLSHEPGMGKSSSSIGPIIVMMGIVVVFSGIQFFCSQHRILYVPFLLLESFLLIVLERHNKKRFDQQRGLIKVPGNS